MPAFTSNTLTPSRFTLHFSLESRSSLPASASDHCPLIPDHCLCVPNHTRENTARNPNNPKRIPDFIFWHLNVMQNTKMARLPLTVHSALLIAGLW